MLLFESLDVFRALRLWDDELGVVDDEGLDEDDDCFIDDVCGGTNEGICDINPIGNDGKPGNLNLN